MNRVEGYDERRPEREQLSLLIQREVEFDVEDVSPPMSVTRFRDDAEQ